MYINLLNININQLKKYIYILGEKKFCVIQIIKWVYQYNITDFNKMTNISKSLKKKMNLLFYILVPKIIDNKISSDGTIKWIMDVGNFNTIETVLILNKNKTTLCISSQIGCTIKCKFCYTGTIGFKRNLNVNEIIGQIWKIKYEINNNYNLYNIKKTTNINNIVIMGMGEPLLNFKNILNSLNIITNKNSYAISKKNITLSTSGIVPMIDKLLIKYPISLAISLHASNDKLRNKLIPLNKKYSLKKILKSCKKYALFSPKKNITFEYCMLNGINDKDSNAYELIKLIYNKKNKKKIKCKFNLIPFNKFPGSNFKRSSNLRIKSFAKILIKAGIITTIRKTRGLDINAACGQLTGLIK